MTTRVCAWCDRVLGEKPGPIGITHTICNTCLPSFLNGVRVLTTNETNNTTTETTNA